MNMNLKDIQIIINGVVMKPIVINSAVSENILYNDPILRLEMGLPMFEYTRIKTDKERSLHARSFGIKSAQTNSHQNLSIVNVIFNEPATIVFWSDKTKTVVKTQNGEPFDPEKGLAMAILKRTQGNKGNYNNEFHQWTKNYQPKETGK